MPFWRGTPAEFAELAAAVQRNCTCEVPSTTNPDPPKCPAHQMLDDQRTLSGLEFERFITRRLIDQEGPLPDAP